MGFRTVIHIIFLLVLYNDIMACHPINIMVYAVLIEEEFMILRQFRNRGILLKVSSQLNLLSEHLPDIIAGIMELEEFRESAARNDLLPVFVLILL